MRVPCRSLLLAFVTALVAKSALAAPAVWAEGPTVKLRPDAPPAAARAVSLVGARNEFVAFQVGVHGGQAGLRGVRASFAGLRGPASIGGTDVTLYREALIEIRTPTIRADDEATGRWPDGLVPDVDEIAGERRSAFPFDVPAGETRAIWADVRVPEDAPAGTYSGTVRLEAEGFATDVPVTLRVVGVTLPSTPSLTTAFMSWVPHVCRAHTGTEDCGGAERARELLARYQRMALEHRITLSAFFVGGPESGDWSRFDAAYAPYLDGTAATRLPGARMTSAQYGGIGATEDVRSWADHFRERGWIDRLYSYTADEPPYHVTFDEVRARAEAIKAAAPDVRTLVTTSITELERHALTGLVDLVVPVVNFIDGTKSPYVGDQRTRYDAFLSRPGKGLWLYESCMSHGCAYGTNAPENTGELGWPSYMIDRSAAKNRAMQWVAYLEDASGELYYQTVGMLGTAWTDQYRYNGNGDGTLFLPGTSATIGGTTDVPVSSVRLKQIRAGVQDFEWLKLVSEAGDPAFAREVAKSVVPAASRVGDDGRAFDAARERLIERYVELRGEDRVPQDPSIPGTPATPGADDPGSTGADGPPVQSGCASAGVTKAGLLVLAAVALLLRRRAKRPLPRWPRHR